MGVFFHRTVLHRLGRTGDPVGEKALSPQGKTAVTRYSLFALKVIAWCAKPTTLVFACLSVLVWALFGPSCDWSNTWQLVVNTSTTIVNFLLGFIIINAHEVEASRSEAKQQGLDAKLDRILALLETTLEKRS
jgi:low affinity Fe/Cu permease